MRKDYVLQFVCKESSLKPSHQVRAKILADDRFINLAKEVKAKDRLSIGLASSLVHAVKAFMGSCAVCGGKMVSRNGIHFDNQSRCIVCGNIEND